MSLLFDKIAPIYGLFYDFQVRNYKKALGKIPKDLKLESYNNIIDIGCGTGALCSVLAENGLSVTGIDTAQKMLDVAIKRTENEGITFKKGSVLDKLPFEDKSFDISIASYVAHGLSPLDRQIMYKEMARITKNIVIIYDYNDERSIMTSIVEWMEKGDYFNFIKVVKPELEEFFGNLKEINVDIRATWYICEIKKQDKMED
ncbi:MAG: class I SAM-dependent methyltransferase [Firmicutes bacterium]|nr:class I SAM-dependent methyltransferase [Bacillota bacterium]